MLRKLIILGIFAGASASVPVLWQKNPEAFEAMVRSALEGGEETAAPGAQPVIADRDRAEDQEVALTGRKVTIAADERGHFEGEFRLNGRNVQALIDTGATVVALNETTARSVGIGLTPADFRYEVNTANGKVRAAAVTVDSLRIGRIYVENLQAVVLEDRALSQALVGMSFLNRLSRYEVENGTLVMEQ